MDKRQFFEAITLISKFFGTQWPNEALGSAFESVALLPIEAMQAAHKRVYVEFPPKPLPAIKRIVSIVEEEAAKISQQAQAESVKKWELEKQKSPENFGDLRDNHKRKSVKLIDKILSGEMNKEQIAEACRHMETKFPGVGWKDEELYWIESIRQQEPHHADR